MIGVCPAIETAAGRVPFLWRVEGRADTLVRQFPDAASESRRAVDLASAGMLTVIFPFRISAGSRRSFVRRGAGRRSLTSSSRANPPPTTGGASSNG